MIPKIVHQYWTGGPIPAAYLKFHERWREMNPDWAFYLWSDESLEIRDPEVGLVNADLWSRAEEYVPPGRQYQFRGDLVRYELLYRYGGIWIDMDFEPLLPLDNWFDAVNGDLPFAAWEVQDEWIANGFMGSPAKNWFTRLLIQRLPESAESFRGSAPTRISGPQYLTRLWREQSEQMRVLPQSMFYPYSWRDLGRPRSRPPWPAECVAVHHWNNKRRTGVSPRKRRK